MLAGGAGRRLGGIAKGLERVGDTRIIDRVASCLRAVTPELLLVANDPDAERWLDGVPVARDRHPGTGGLAGVEAALGTGRDVLVVAWDMPFVTPPVLRLLLDTARMRDADVVVPQSESPHGFEPFCGYYAHRVAAPLSRFLESGGGAAGDFIATLETAHYLPTADLATLGDPARIFFSVNTPADLERARAMAGTTK